MSVKVYGCNHVAIEVDDVEILRTCRKSGPEVLVQKSILQMS